ncbi:MAG: 1-acyl-sn-glycerol-3-phosphate acyltransferase [Marinibacterium sp.]|nr:1-acyl-sn-glycerol-3-phosphate acyltransferase [Marinibacterium sp.]
MSPTWHSDDLPDWQALGPGGWLRVVLRGVPLALLVFGGLAVLLLVRLVERPLCGMHRPVTPHITRCVCRGALRILGIRLTVHGTVSDRAGALVANHASWLDIFTLNACTTLYFVSKAEVASWPGIGWLARATGTVFITRDRRDARAQTDLFRARLGAGHRLLFFPEGTSSDGRRVLGFKPTLFAAFFDDGLRAHLEIQPLTVVYTAPKGQDRRFFGWWGDMGFEPHLLQVLARKGRGAVDIHAHPPVCVRDFADRKALARQLETTVRVPLSQAIEADPIP